MVVFDRAAFNRARSAWEAQGITSYTFEMLDAPWDPWLRITVMGGEVVRLEEVGAEKYGNVLYRWSGLMGIRGTVPLMFEWIEGRYRALLANLEPSSAYRFYIIVRYNADYHFPERFGSAMEGEDGGGQTTLRNFQPLE